MEPKTFSFENQKKVKDFKLIECKAFDTYKDFKADPSGYYILIKVNPEYYTLDVAVCNKDHEIENVFRGRASQDLYLAILEYQKKNDSKWFTDLTHVAYLGKELKKAEFALVSGNLGYFQE